MDNSMSKVAAVYEPAFRMSREEYRLWAEQQAAGRFERVNGVVVAMAPERANHNLRKFRAAQALDAAVRGGGLSCQVCLAMG
jgi:Uma2 family endonuclease